MTIFANLARKATKSRRPTLRFLFAHPAHFIACGMGSGLSPFAPGTAGTLFAWVSFWGLTALMNRATLIYFLVAALIVGIWACHKTGRDLGVPDHGSIVWDEIVPFWTVLFFTPDTILWQAVAFFAFRFYDVAKPQPARWVDGNMKHGFGVMLDDVIAAAYTVATIWLLQAGLAYV